MGVTFSFLNMSIGPRPLTNSLLIGRSRIKFGALLAAAYDGLGQPAEAKAAMENGMALRPGSTLSNVALPRKNASAAFLAAVEKINWALVAAGLPEH
jgi:hypothetical protein